MSSNHQRVCAGASFPIYSPGPVAQVHSTCCLVDRPHFLSPGSGWAQHHQSCSASCGCTRSVAPLFSRCMTLFADGFSSFQFPYTFSVSLPPCLPSSPFLSLSSVPLRSCVKDVPFGHSQELSLQSPSSRACFPVLTGSFCPCIPSSDISLLFLIQVHSLATEQPRLNLSEGFLDK